MHFSVCTPIPVVAVVVVSSLWAAGVKAEGNSADYYTLSDYSSDKDGSGGSVSQVFAPAYNHSVNELCRYVAQASRDRLESKGSLP